MVTDEKFSIPNFCVFNLWCGGGGCDDDDAVAVDAIATALCTGDIRWLLKWYNIIFCFLGEGETTMNSNNSLGFVLFCRSFVRSFSLLIYFTCGRYYNIRLQVLFFIISLPWFRWQGLAKTCIHCCKRGMHSQIHTRAFACKYAEQRGDNDNVSNDNKNNNKNVQCKFIMRFIDRLPLSNS